MSYRREVERLLGKKCMTKLLNHVRGGKMSDNQMKDFVLELGELSKRVHEDPNTLFGNHTRRMSRDRKRKLDTEILEVLNDWWGTSLYQMTQSQAVEALAKALSHPNVGCNELASKLSTIHNPQYTSTTSEAKKLHSKPSAVEPSVTPSARLSGDLQPPLELSGAILKDKTPHSIHFRFAF